MFDVHSLLHRQHPVPAQETVHFGFRLADVFDGYDKHLQLHSGGWFMADFTEKNPTAARAGFYGCFTFILDSSLRCSSAVRLRSSLASPRLLRHLFCSLTWGQDRPEASVVEGEFRAAVEALGATRAEGDEKPTAMREPRKTGLAKGLAMVFRLRRRREGGEAARVLRSAARTPFRGSSPELDESATRASPAFRNRRLESRPCPSTTGSSPPCRSRHW